MTRPRKRRTWHHFNRQLGQRVAAHRLQHGLTQAELADKAGLSDWMSVSRIELAIVRVRAEDVARLAAALGVPTSDLYPEAKG